MDSSKPMRPALKYYYRQSIGAFVYMAIVIFILDCVSTQSFVWAVAITSIASSACIVFTRPHAHAAEPRRMIWSYGLSIIVGYCFFHASTWMMPLIGHRLSVELFGAAAVGFFIFLIALLDFQHPPAVGVVFGFTIEPWHYQAVLVIAASVLALVMIHVLAKRRMRDLYLH